MKIAALASGLLFTGWARWAQSELHAQELVDHAQVVEDIRYFLGALEDTHPDPYSAFGGKVAFKLRAGELLAAVPDEGLDAVGVHALLMAFLSELGDGHTGIAAPPSETPDQPSRVLPIRFGVAANGVFVSEAGPGHRDLLGHSLVAAEGIPVAELQVRARALFPTENVYGAARGVTRALRSARNTSRLLGRRVDSLLVRLQVSDGTEVERHIPYVDRDSPDAAARPGTVWDRVEVDAGPIWWRYLEDSKVGYLRMESIQGREAFAEARGRRDLPGYLAAYHRRYVGGDAPTDLDSALARIPCFTPTVKDLLTTMRAHGSDYLIVDLRSNGGGWSSLVVPFLLLTYGAEYFDYPFPDQWIDVLSPQFLAMNGWTTDSLAARWGSSYAVGDYRVEVAGTPRAGRSMAEYSVTLEPMGCDLAAEVARLEGQPLHRPTVVVLIDPGTFSAAFQFAYHLRLLGARLVGVPSAQAGNAFTNVVRIALPHSRLRGSIARSVQRFFPDEPAIGHVMVADFPMTVSDFAKYGFDRHAEVLYALDLIQAGRVEPRASRDADGR